MIKTDENLLNVTFNDVALTQDDIDKATSLGETDGKTIVYWVPYTELPKTITLGTVNGNKRAKTITITK